MYSEETKSSSLAKFLSIYDYVFVDTCSLMEDSFPVFMDNLTASHKYWKDGLHVIVLGECIEELKKHSANKDNQEARIEAERALKILRHDKWFHRILEVGKSNNNYGFADNAIYTAVSSLRIQNKVLIITQDKTLATDLKKLNSLDSQRGRYVLVYRLNQQGDLEENPGETGLYQARTYSSAPRSASNNTKDRHFRSGLFHKEKPTRSEEPVEDKPVLDSPIVSADKRLMANLNNPNYPVERKLADLNEQIVAIDALSAEDKSKLSLAYTYDELLEERRKLAPKPAVTPTSTAAAKPVETKLAAPVVPEAKKEVAPVPQPAPVAPAKPISPAKPQHLWFEFGSTIQEALTRTGAHYGILFRDPSVPYFPMVHGPYDLTSKDLDNLAKQVGVLKPGEKKDLPLGTLVAHIEKTEKDFKATIEIPAKVEPKVETAAQKAPILTENEPAKTEGKTPAKETPAKAVAPKADVHHARRATSEKPVAAKATALKKAETKPAPTKPASAEAKEGHKSVSSVRKKPVASKEEPSVTAQDVNTAVPSGATLLVGVPTNDDRRGFIERRIRREDTSTLEAVPNPDKGRRGRKTPSKETKITAKNTKPISQDVPEGDLAAILKEDKNLNAKINNPNYPLNQKIADLQEQKGKLRKLKNPGIKDLLWPLAKIDAKLKELSVKK
jgi:rRNA-processing protein FCF1